LSQLFADGVGYDMNPVIHVFQLTSAVNGDVKREGKTSDPLSGAR
jgi:hypothetical protein